MSDIPSGCLPVILSRLTAEELLELRLVSKAWCQTINDPVFIKLHINYHQTTESDQHLLIRNKSGNELYSLPLDSFDFSEKRQNTVWSRPVNKRLTQHGLSNLHALPVPSCNGLILIHDDQKMISVLWNPLMGEFRELPSCVPSIPLVPVLASGLGYDSDADDYKVVRIVSTMATSVYSLKSNTWRRIGDFPGRVHVGGHSLGNGFFLNGALHWIGNMQGGEQRIIALDLGTEKYNVLSPPSVLSNQDARRIVNLNVLGGCLFMSCCDKINIYQHSLEGWIMNEYGETDSWTKLFSFTGLYCAHDIEGLRPIAYWKSKGLVLIKRIGQHEFSWIYVKERKRKVLRMRGAPDDLTCQVFKASLVRLNTNNRGGVGNGVVEGVVGRKSIRADDSSSAKNTASRKRKRDDDWLRLVLNHNGKNDLYGCSY